MFLIISKIYLDIHTSGNLWYPTAQLTFCISLLNMDIMILWDNNKNMCTTAHYFCLSCVTFPKYCITSSLATVWLR